MLSLLDRTRTRAGEPDAAAVRGTVARARDAERQGYARFWVAEHHAVPGIGSGAPTVLLAAVGAATSRIGLGTGGVMLPHHQPLVVAEQAMVLAALHPGRVALGLGRSSGFTAPVRAALREDPDGRDDFAADVAELRAYLDGTGPVTARPALPADAGEPGVPLWVLATGSGLDVAARLGLPVVVGGPLLDEDRAEELADRLAAYRRTFVPSPRAERPRVTVSLDVLVADTAAEARDLALPEAWAMADARRTGSFGPLETVATVRARLGAAGTSQQVRDRVARGVERAVAGTEATVAARLAALTDRAGAVEVLSSASTTDRAALADSDARLARVLAAAPVAAGADL